MQRTLIFVNGYGATQDLFDPQYITYLGTVVDAIQRYPNPVLVLSGGRTNLQTYSEAQCMLDILQINFPYVFERLADNPVLLEHVWRARDGLQELSRLIDLEQESPSVVIFCEWSRRLTMHMLAHQVLKRTWPDRSSIPVKVWGVAFDRKSYTLRAHMSGLGQMVLERAALSSALVDAFMEQRRRRHVARCRA